MALWGTLHSQGPFHRDDPNESLLLLQAFVGLNAALALAFNAVWPATPYSQLATISLGLTDAALRTRTRKVA